MQKALVIDSGLLVLLIVGSVNPKYILKHKNLRVFTVPNFEMLRDMVARAPKVICTAHILAETSSLLRQIGDPIKSELMASFQRLIHTADYFEEMHIGSKAASSAPCFIRLGLTDAAIVSLDPAAVQILTVDHDLHIESSDKGFDVVNLNPFFHDI